VDAARLHQITVISPMLLDHSAQARAGAGYDKASFAFDFDTGQATCPQGNTSSTWTTARQRDTDAIVVSWATSTCGPCPVRQACTTGKRRHITIPSRELHEALIAAIQTTLS
jgi:Transposase DDE domain